MTRKVMPEQTMDKPTLSEIAKPEKADGAPFLARVAQSIKRWRNGMVARPGFQHAAKRFPLTRGISNKKANSLFRLTGGFVHSQVLFACVELDLFKHLANTALHTAELTHKIGLTSERTELLLGAAKGLSLVYENLDGAWELDELGAVMAGNQGLQDMVRHHAMLYRDLADPIALLKAEKSDTEIAAYWAYAGRPEKTEIDEAETAPYSALMQSSLDMVAAEALDSYPFQNHETLLDIGGGNGTFLIEAGKRHDHLNLWLFDLPSVAENGRESLISAGYEKRSKSFGGSFFKNEIPKGADCVSLIRVLFDHTDANALNLLKNLRKAMDPKANLVICEPMADDNEGSGLANAYFSLYFLAMQSGKCRSAGEIFALLEQAGFSDAVKRKTHTPLIASMIVARP